MKITTEDQFYGFVAVDDDRYDGPGSPIGSGNTEREAINDLLDILEDDASYAEFVEEIQAKRAAINQKPSP